MILESFCYNSTSYVSLNERYIYIIAELRQALKIDFLEKQFRAFGDKTQADFENMQMQLEPKKVQKEMVNFFNDVAEKMAQFSEDVEKWDGSNQKVSFIFKIHEKYKNLKMKIRV